jgi:hypothetical protein
MKLKPSVYFFRLQFFYIDQGIIVIIKLISKSKSKSTNIYKRLIVNTTKY